MLSFTELTMQTSVCRHSLQLFVCAAEQHCTSLSLGQVTLLLCLTSRMLAAPRHALAACGCKQHIPIFVHTGGDYYCVPQLVLGGAPGMFGMPLV